MADLGQRGADQAGLIDRRVEQVREVAAGRGQEPPGRLHRRQAEDPESTACEALREDLPAAAGRQALADRDVTLIIDGVSEVPDDIRRALGEEFRAPEAAGSGVQIMLLGRDMAAVRFVLPTDRPAAVYDLAASDRGRRLDLACRVLWGTDAVLALVPEVLDAPVLRKTSYLQRRQSALATAASAATTTIQNTTPIHACQPWGR